MLSLIHILEMDKSLPYVILVCDPKELGIDFENVVLKLGDMLLKALETKDEKEKLHIYEIVAEANCIEAQVKLAELYDNCLLYTSFWI